MDKKIAVISLSGGMDSTCLLVKLLAEEYDVYALSFDYGQKHKIELRKAWQNIIYLRQNGFKVKGYKKIKLPIGDLFESALLNSDQEVPEGHYEQENMKATVVPNRNAIFGSITYGYALSLANRLNRNVEIFLGVHSGDHEIYPDCRPEFFGKLNEAFASGNWGSEKVKYNLPYLYADKTMILKDCIDNCLTLSIEFDEVLKNTMTSYNPDSSGKASGKSGSDIERIEAFINIDRKDPIPYIGGWEKARAHAVKVLSETTNEFKEI